MEWYVLGYAAVAYVLWKCFIALWQLLFPFVLAPALGLTKDLRKFCGGSWAVITGATDGIGKSYAKELASKGYNLLLISRSEPKLQATAQEIKELYGEVEIKWVVFDFTVTDLSCYEKIQGTLDELEIGILVNNVGITYHYPQKLDTIKNGEEVFKDIVTINCLATTLMTKYVVSQMKKRGKGAIIIMSSAAGTRPTPYASVYSASKVFGGFLSECLQAEYENDGVYFQCVYPYFVATKMNQVMKSSFLVPPADEYARSAIRTIGIQQNTYGCFSHALQAFFIDLLPRKLQVKASMQLFKTIGERTIQWIVRNRSNDRLKTS